LAHAPTHIIVRGEVARGGVSCAVETGEVQGAEEGRMVIREAAVIAIPGSMSVHTIAVVPVKRMSE